MDTGAADRKRNADPNLFGAQANGLQLRGGRCGLVNLQEDADHVFPSGHPPAGSSEDGSDVGEVVALLSTAAGAEIGAGVGAGIEAGIDASAKNQVEEGHLLTVMFAMLGGVVGMGVGQGTDFLAGPTIYRTP